MKSFATVAFENHILQGLPISRLEAICLYGVQNPTAIISRLRKDGFQIERTNVPMEKVIRRLQKTMKFAPLASLPYMEMKVSEYKKVSIDDPKI